MFKSYKQGQLKPQKMFYVKLERTPVKVHSNLYRYDLEGESLEFVSMMAPAVGGFIVVINEEPPTYVMRNEFHQKYLEEHEWQVK